MDCDLTVAGTAAVRTGDFFGIYILIVFGQLFFAYFIRYGRDEGIDAGKDRFL